MSRARLPRVLALACAASLALQAAVAESLPRRGAADPRIRVVSYDPDDVVRLQGHVGYQIHLEWAEGEEFVNLGAGDVGGFDVGSERNHFFIKPRQQQVGTNLTVLTNRRAYHFEYTVAAGPPTRAAARNMVYSVRFVYPQDEARRAGAEARQHRTEALLAQAPAGRPANTDYWFCGSPSLRPVAARDDGVQTRLRFAPNAEFPAIFVRNDDGSESLLNFSADAGEVVVHRVARRLVLRRGGLVGCIVNRSFEGGGAQPAGHTAVPGVERLTRRPEP